MSGINDNARKVRVGLAVFQQADDLVRAIERLLAAGIGAGDLWIAADTGVGERIRFATGLVLPVMSITGAASATDNGSSFQRWVAGHLQSLIPAGLGEGSAVLIARIGLSTRQLTVSELLLSSNARVVQLHDMAP
jgi:hypothetical protein